MNLSPELHEAVLIILSSRPDCEGPQLLGKGTTAMEVTSVPSAPSASTSEVEFEILAARCELCTRGWVGCRWQDLASFLPIHEEHPEHITYSVRIVGTSQVFDWEIVP
jgi:hypothetical protein